MTAQILLDNPIIDVELALLAQLKKNFPYVPYLEGGNVVEKPIYFGTINRWDLFKNPFGNVDTAKLPAVVLSMAGLMPADPTLEDMTGRTLKPTETDWSTVEQPREFMDLKFSVYFNADNPRVIDYFQNKSVTAFKREMAYLEVPHLMRKETTCYELDVTSWGDGNNQFPNLNNLFESRVDFAIRGVEFGAGITEKLPVIKSYDIPLHRLDQTIEVTVGESGEIIITIVKGDGQNG